MAIAGYHTNRKTVTTNGWLQTNKKFATGCESVKERENYHKQKILMHMHMQKILYAYDTLCITNFRVDFVEK